MKVACLQMDMKFQDPDYNFEHAKELIRANAKDNDVLVLPETWNVGFFPKDNLEELADNDGERVKKEIGSLAKEYNVNIVAGSVANKVGDKLYNTAYIFNREGEVVGKYNKSHLFTPMEEHKYFEYGNEICTFMLDGVKCAMIICYDVRFPEFIRSMTLNGKGVDLLFVVAQWAVIRKDALPCLANARAIENQMYVVSCNSCGTSPEAVYGGNSSIHDPLGFTLARAGEKEEIISAELDFTVIDDIRTSINVFRDRRPELYSI